MAKGDAAPLACEDSGGKEDRPFRCKQCPRSYRHAGSLLNHQRTHEVGLYPCLVCHKDFSNPMALKSHLRTHLKGKRYKCRHCGRSASQLASHRCAARVGRDQEEEEEEEEEEGSNGGSCAFQRGQDTSSSSEADACSKRGSRGGSLLTNLEKYIAESVVPADFAQLQFPARAKAEGEGLLLLGHPGEEEEEEEEEAAGIRAAVGDERRYKCDQCGKAYKHAGSLATHKQSHSLGLLHQCAMCYKAFPNPVALKSHARLHSEYRPYQCRFCHVAFRLPSELLSHQKAHGQEEGSRAADLRSWEGSAQGLWEEDSIETLAKLDIYQPPPAGTDFRESAPCSLRDPSKDGGGERCNPDGELCVRCGGTFAGEEELKGHSCLYPEEGEEEEEEEEEGNSPSRPAPGPNGALEASSKAGESGGLYQERPFHCEDCGRTYRHAGSLINHKKSHQIGVYSCTVCSKQLYNLAALKNHLRVHLKAKLGPSAPEETPPDPPALSENQREAGDAGGSPMRPGDAWRGAPCPKEEGERGAEEEEAEEEERPYRCGDCGRSYRHRGSLVNHRHTHQTGIFQCSICPKQYSNLMALRNHVRVHLRAARLRGRERGGGLTCSGCGESFEEEAEYQLHQLRHLPCAAEGEAAVGPKLALFRCQEADLLQAIRQDVEALENGAAVAEDVLPASEASHACRPCGLAVATEAGLQDHALRQQAEGAPEERSESPVSPQRLYGCDQCGKSYRHSGSLINHKQTHQTGDFRCSACGKHFQNVASLKSHLRGHQRPRRGPAELAVIQNEEGDAEVGDDGAVPGALPLGDEFEGSHEVLEEGAGTNGWQGGSQGPTSLLGDSGAHPCLCDQCGLGFDEADSLMIHRQTHQLGIYQCSLCPKEYPSLLALKSHFHGHARATTATAASTWGHPVGDEEAEEQPFLCSLCGMIFPSEEDLQHHHSLAHDESDAQGGGQEGEELKGEHPEQHLAGAGGREEEALLSHICGYCGQTFDDMASLEEHSEGHLEEKAAALADTSVLLRRAPRPEEDPPPPPPPPPAEVPACHASQAPDNRPYACGQCGKTYRHGGSLVNHKKIHQIGDYRCAVCCRLYPNMSAYRNHLRNHPRCKLKGSVPELCQAAPAAAGGAERPPPLAYEVTEERASGGSCAAPGVTGEPSCAPSLGSPVAEGGSPAGQEPAPSPPEPRKTRLFDICGEVYEGKTVPEGPWPLPLAEEEATAGEETGPGTAEEGSPSERPFQCEACGRRYKHAGSLINHRQTHKTGLFHCHVCQKQFYNLMALKNHNRTHFETKRYRCPQCPKAFRLQKQLAGHQRAHQERAADPPPHPARRAAPAKRAGKAEGSARPAKPPLDPKERPYRCGECSRTYRHAGSLLNHQKSHKVGHFSCALCGKAYPNLMSLKNHQRIHYEVKRHQCPECGKAFKWQRQLLRHRRRPHPCGGGGGGGTAAPGPEAGGDSGASGTEQGRGCAGAAAASFACHVCSRCFPSHAALKSHARVHAKKRSECSECGKSYRSAKELACHRRKHQREAVAAAADGHRGGDAASPSPAAADKTPEERPYKCDSCERTYRHAGSLLNHQQVHATGLYRCPMCQQEFRNRLALKNHLHLHKNKRRHWCSRCGKHFRTAKRLAVHARSHGEQKGEGTLACPLCSKGFSHQTSFRQHQLLHAKGGGHPGAAWAAS